MQKEAVPAQSHQKENQLNQLVLYIQESFGEHLQQHHGGLAAEVASALCSPGGTQVVVEAETVVALIHGGLQGWGLSGSDQPP